MGLVRSPDPRDIISTLGRRVTRKSCRLLIIRKLEMDKFLAQCGAGTLPASPLSGGLVRVVTATSVQLASRCHTCVTTRTAPRHRPWPHSTNASGPAWESGHGYRTSG